MSRAQINLGMVHVLENRTWHPGKIKAGTLPDRIQPHVPRPNTTYHNLTYRNMTHNVKSIATVQKKKKKKSSET